ncbi:MAG: transposase [Armatimonadetes bacterium]|nr:transposase [Armatimonadota bacterium]
MRRPESARCSAASSRICGRPNANVWQGSKTRASGSSIADCGVTAVTGLWHLREPRLGHRDEYPVEVLWRCVVAKFVYQIKTYAELVRELWRNGSLRRVVGLEGSIPRDYHFSRLLKRLSSPVGRRLLQAILPEASASRSSRALAWACCRAMYSGAQVLLLAVSLAATTKSGPVLSVLARGVSNCCSRAAPLGGQGHRTNDRTPSPLPRATPPEL